MQFNGNDVSVFVRLRVSVWDKYNISDCKCGLNVCVGLCCDFDLCTIKFVDYNKSLIKIPICEFNLFVCTFSAPWIQISKHGEDDLLKPDLNFRMKGLLVTLNVLWVLVPYGVVWVSNDLLIYWAVDQHSHRSSPKTREVFFSYGCFIWLSFFH